MTVAGFGGVVCMKLWEIAAVVLSREQLLRVEAPLDRGNWVRSFMLRFMAVKTVARHYFRDLKLRDVCVVCSNPY